MVMLSVKMLPGLRAAAQGERGRQRVDRCPRSRRGSPGVLTQIRPAESVGDERRTTVLVGIDADRMAAAPEGVELDDRRPGLSGSWGPRNRPGWGSGSRSERGYFGPTPPHGAIRSLVPAGIENPALSARKEAGLPTTSAFIQDSGVERDLSQAPGLGLGCRNSSPGFEQGLAAPGHALRTTQGLLRSADRAVVEGLRQDDRIARPGAGRPSRRRRPGRCPARSRSPACRRRRPP